MQPSGSLARLRLPNSETGDADPAQDYRSDAKLRQSGLQHYQCRNPKCKGRSRGYYTRRRCLFPGRQRKLAFPIAVRVVMVHNGMEAFCVLVLTACAIVRKHSPGPSAASWSYLQNLEAYGLPFYAACPRFSDSLNTAAGKDSAGNKLTAGVILRWLEEIPHSFSTELESRDTDMVFRFRCDAGQSRIVATKDSLALFPATQRTILICWGSACPVPFCLPPDPNTEYLDLKYGLTSRKLSGLACTIRAALESHGYHFYTPKGKPRSEKSRMSRILRRSRKRLELGASIGERVRIAGHVITLPSDTIGEEAAAGAYSLVTKDVKSHALVYGIPVLEHQDKYGILNEDINPRDLVQNKERCC